MDRDKHNSIVGREQIISRFEEILDNPRIGKEFPLLNIWGERGSGKSSLLGHFHKIAKERGMLSFVLSLWMMKLSPEELFERLATYLNGSYQITFPRLGLFILRIANLRWIGSPALPFDVFDYPPQEKLWDYIEGDEFPDEIATFLHKLLGTRYTERFWGLGQQELIWHLPISFAHDIEASGKNIVLLIDDCDGSALIPSRWICSTAEHSNHIFMITSSEKPLRLEGKTLEREHLTPFTPDELYRFFRSYGEEFIPKELPLNLEEIPFATPLWGAMLLFALRRGITLPDGILSITKEKIWELFWNTVSDDEKKSITELFLLGRSEQMFAPLPIISHDDMESWINPDVLKFVALATASVPTSEITLDELSPLSYPIATLVTKKEDGLQSLVEEGLLGLLLPDTARTARFNMLSSVCWEFLKHPEIIEMIAMLGWQEIFPTSQVEQLIVPYIKNSDPLLHLMGLLLLSYIESKRDEHRHANDLLLEASAIIGRNIPKLANSTPSIWLLRAMVSLLKARELAVRGEQSKAIDELDSIRVYTQRARQGLGETYSGVVALFEAETELYRIEVTGKSPPVALETFASIENTIKRTADAMKNENLAAYLPYRMELLRSRLLFATGLNNDAEEAIKQAYSYLQKFSEGLPESRKAFPIAIGNFWLEEVSLYAHYGLHQKALDKIKEIDGFLDGFSPNELARNPSLLRITAEKGLIEGKLSIQSNPNFAPRILERSLMNYGQLFRMLPNAIFAQEGQIEVLHLLSRLDEKAQKHRDALHNWRDCEKLIRELLRRKPPNEDELLEKLAGTLLRKARIEALLDEDFDRSLSEAIHLFEMVARRGQEYEAQALFGLGQALVLRVTSASSRDDPRELMTILAKALDCFSEALDKGCKRADNGIFLVGSTALSIYNRTMTQGDYTNAFGATLLAGKAASASERRKLCDSVSKLIERWEHFPLSDSHYHLLLEMEGELRKKNDTATT